MQVLIWYKQVIRWCSFNKFRKLGAQEDTYITKAEMQKKVNPMVK